jgi:FkbM family methyltransferase
MDFTVALAQFVNDRALAARSPQWQRLTFSARRALSRRIDPGIRIEVAGQYLRAPFSHNLPFFQKFHPNYDLNVGMLAALVHEWWPHAAMVDVGANVGDTAAIARTHAPGLPILCVEGNPAFASFLRENAANLGNVEVAETVLLSDHDGTLSGSFTSERGTAEFHSQTSAAVVRTLTLDTLLAKHPSFRSPKLVKSDTDGFEGHVLRGASQTLEQAKPVLLLEYEPPLLDQAGTDGLEMLKLLRERDYAQTLVYDSFGVPVCMTSLADTRLLGDLDRYVRTKMLYLDLAIFPSTLDEIAAELYARESGSRS